MTNLQICPHCGKESTPVEKMVKIWDRDVPRRHAGHWITISLLSLFLIGPGILLIIFFHLTAAGLAGGGTIAVGCIVLGGLCRRMWRMARIQQRRQVCSLCNRPWPGLKVAQNQNEYLETYFTDVEELRAEFDRMVIASSLPRHLFVIHGVGGIGKSSLLRMFRLQCRDQQIPVALASGDEAKSFADILTGWARELTVQDIDLPNFARILHEYKILQGKVEERVRNEQKTTSQANKGTLKLVVQTATSLASIIPGVGLPLSMVLGGNSDTLVDWLHSFLSPAQVNLLLDPTDELEENFLQDLVTVCARARNTRTHGRLILLLDTFEQLATLSNWLATFAQRLPGDVLLVVAGRSVPDWGKRWPDWHAHAKIEELKPMNADVMRTLIHRYYNVQRGGIPDPAQVEAIVQFARGLPVAITTIVQLWIQYGIEDFQTVRAQVVADLVDQLTSGLPERVRPALKAAATLRWFNRELLSLVSGGEAVSDDVYEDLRRLPLVRSRREGLALHDSVREHLDGNIRIQEPGLHQAMHQRAADYFQTQLHQEHKEEITDLALEALYHSIMAHEERGIQEFRREAEELVRYQLLNPLRILLNDVYNHRLQKENSRLWRDYYRARLIDLGGRPADAIPLYQAIAGNLDAEKMLRAYALCDCAWFYVRVDTSEKARQLEQIRELIPEPDELPEPDAKLGMYLLEMSDLYREQGSLDDALIYLQRAQKMYRRLDDPYWLAFTYNRFKYFYLDTGKWLEARKWREWGLQETKRLTDEKQRSYIEAELLAGVSIGWMWAGVYKETEQDLRRAIALAEKYERVQQTVYFKRDLAFIMGLQGNVTEAIQELQESTATGKIQDPMFEIYSEGFQGIIKLNWVGASEAEEHFQACQALLPQAAMRGIMSPTFLYFSALAAETRGNLEQAKKIYHECLENQQAEQSHWRAGMLTGLARIYYRFHQTSAFTATLQEANALAAKYGYNQYLSSLRVVQGHQSWNDQAKEQRKRFDEALLLYQEALIYALRYNRFHLDEVLSGKLPGTPLLPIIEECRAHGEDGPRMLRLIQQWWQSGKNTLHRAEPETILSVPEDIPLLEAEELIRRREPGDGKVQRRVIEQIAQAIKASLED